LRQPISRASYLLSLNGIKLDEETDTHMAPGFLMEQMELREELGDAAAASDPQQALDNVTNKLLEGIEQSLSQFKEAAQTQDWQQARTVVRQWQFLDKLRTEVHAQEAQLDA
jgi:molecular chaperone HscB